MRSLLEAAGRATPPTKLREAVLDSSQRLDGLESLGLRLPRLDHDPYPVATLDASHQGGEALVAEHVSHSGQPGQSGVAEQAAGFGVVWPGTVDPSSNRQAQVVDEDGPLRPEGPTTSLRPRGIRARSDHF